MPKININNVQLFYELSGSGEIPVATVHGSWVMLLDHFELTPAWVE